MKYAFNSTDRKVLAFSDTYERKWFCEKFTEFEPVNKFDLDCYHGFKPKELEALPLYSSEVSIKVNELMAEIKLITGKEVILR
jgi:hypothetical protein